MVWTTEISDWNISGYIRWGTEDWGWESVGQAELG